MENNVRNIQTELIAKNWGKLQKVTYEFKRDDGVWEPQTREVYDRGHGATILLYNTQKRTILLTRQFRIPTYLNGNKTGLMIETPAGKLDEVNPDDCIVREVEEETGYRIPSAKRIFELFMSPGSVTEIIYFYTAPYDDSMKVSKGGGLETEQENIEVLELHIDKARSMLESGEIKDGKTVLLIQHALVSKLL